MPQHEQFRLSDECPRVLALDRYWLQTLRCSPNCPSPLSLSSSRFSNGACPLTLFHCTASIAKHPPRSTSGNSFMSPDRGGHSIEKWLLDSAEASTSPSMDHA